MPLIAICFLSGNCLLQLAPHLPDAMRCGMLLVVAIAASGILAALRRTSWSGAVLALFLGMGWAWVHASMRMADQLASEVEGKDVSAVGWVSSIPSTTPYGVRFQFDVDPAHAELPSRVELTWYDDAPRLAAGQRWQITMRLRRPRGFANPGGFDYESQLLREGIGATGYVRHDEGNRMLAVPSRYPVLRARAWLTSQLTQALGDSPMLGILQGLAVGEQQAMSARQWRVFARTGTTHLMAISGLHIGMVALLAAWLGGQSCRLPWAQRRGPAKVDARAASGLSAALIYSLLAGFSVPTQRTLVMLGVYFGAQLLRRTLAPWHGLSVALILVLLIDPFAPLSAGMWLSFGAVLVILLAVTGRLHREATLPQYLRVQAAVTIGLAPLLVVAFGSVSLISPAVNLIAIPFFTLFVVPVTLLGLVLCVLWAPGGTWLLQALARLLEWMWPVLESAAALPIAVWHLPQPAGWAMALMTAGSVLLVAPGFVPTRLAGVLLCIPALCWQAPRPAHGEFELAMLDVGQGLAVAVRTAGHVLVYDAGPRFRSGRDTGELVVLPYLRHLGVRHIDVLLASHGDLDHAGGLDTLLSEMKVDRALGGPSVPSPAMSERCVAGQRWTWDGVEFEILHPPAKFSGGDNDSSCVLRVSARRGSALLLGDIGKDIETELVDAGLGRHDVVVAAHHGSLSSSTDALVTATSPQYVLFSAGHRNRWGFPKADVVQRWQRAGAQAFDTARSGAVEIHVGPSGVEAPREYRRTEQRYWRSE